MSAKTAALAAQGESATTAALAAQKGKGAKTQALGAQSMGAKDVSTDGSDAALSATIRRLRQT